MKRITATTVALTLASTLCAMMAASASASAGPQFLTARCVRRYVRLGTTGTGALNEANCLDMIEESGIPQNAAVWNLQTEVLAEEEVRVTATNLGDFTLKDSAGVSQPLCTGLSAPTSLFSGGESETDITFTGCTVSGHEKCDSLSVGETPGIINVPADDELVYVGTKLEAEMEEGPLGDRFTPQGGGTTFVKLLFLALESGACPSSAEVAVEGSVIGLVEPVNVMATEGMLQFPEPAIKKGYQWLSAGHVDEVTAGLKFPGGAATQVGLADLQLESGGEWGVLTK